MYDLGNKTPRDNVLGQEPTGPLQWEKFQRDYSAILAAGRKALKLPYRYPAWEPGAPLEFTAFDRSARMLACLFVRDADIHWAQADRARAVQGCLDAMDLGSRLPRGGGMLAVQHGQWAFDIGWNKLDVAVAELDASTCLAILKRLRIIEAARPKADEVLREEGRRDKRPPGEFALSYTPPTKEARDFALQVWQLPRNTPSPATSKSWIPFDGVDYFHTLFVFDCQQLEFDTLRVRLALRLYYLQTGLYPETLAELSQRLLPQVPRDPFGAGEPLRYRREGDTYRLWSVGWDGIDNGGIGYVPAPFPVLPVIFRPLVTDPTPQQTSLKRWRAVHPYYYGQGDFVSGPEY